VYDKINCTSDIYGIIPDDLTYKINPDKHEFGLLSEMTHSDRTGIYSWFYPDQIEELLNLIRNDKMNLPQEHIDELKKLTPDSNPIIFYYEYKDIEDE